MTVDAIIFIGTIFTTKDRAPGMAGLLCRIISKCMPKIRVSYALFHSMAQTHTGRLARVQLRCNALRYTSSFERHVLRSFSLLSLSSSPRVLVPVDFFSRRDPKQSSKVPLPPVLHCPKIRIALMVRTELSVSGTCQALPI